MTDVTNSVTFHNVDSDTYARLLAVANGSAPAAVGSEKPAKEKKSKPEAEPETTPADDFEADQADERKTYTEKALTKLVDKKDRDGLAAIAETYGLDIKGKRAGTLKDMILAAQIEAKEQAASDDGKPDAKDADDYAEDEPAASKKGKKAKSDKKGKKGSKK